MQLNARNAVKKRRGNIKAADDAVAAVPVVEPVVVPVVEPVPAPAPAPVPVPGKGIENKSIECYCISVAQMLYSIPEFRGAIMSAAAAMTDSSASPVIHHLNRIFTDLAATNIPGPVSSDDVQALMKLFAGAEVDKQQDADEFMKFIFSKLPDDMLDIFKLSESGVTRCYRSEGAPGISEKPTEIPSNQPATNVLSVELKPGDMTTSTGALLTFSGESKWEDISGMELAAQGCARQQRMLKYVPLNANKYVILTTMSPLNVDPVVELDGKKYQIHGAVLYSGMNGETGHYIYNLYDMTGHAGEDISSVPYVSFDDAVVRENKSVMDINKNGRILVYKSIGGAVEAGAAVAPAVPIEDVSGIAVAPAAPTEDLSGAVVTTEAAAVAPVEKDPVQAKIDEIIADKKKQIESITQQIEEFKKKNPRELLNVRIQVNPFDITISSRGRKVEVSQVIIELQVQMKILEDQIKLFEGKKVLNIFGDRYYTEYIMPSELNYFNTDLGIKSLNQFIRDYNIRYDTGDNYEKIMSIFVEEFGGATDAVVADTPVTCTEEIYRYLYPHLKYRVGTLENTIKRFEKSPTSRMYMDIKQKIIDYVNTLKCSAEMEAKAVGTKPVEMGTMTGPGYPNLQGIITPLENIRNILRSKIGGPVATAEAATEIAPNAAPNVAPNAAPEVAPVVASDVAPEVAPVVAPEVAPNAAPEVAPVAAPVVAPEAAPETALTKPTIQDIMKRMNARGRIPSDKNVPEMKNAVEEYIRYIVNKRKIITPPVAAQVMPNIPESPEDTLHLEGTGPQPAISNNGINENISYYTGEQVPTEIGQLENIRRGAVPAPVYTPSQRTIGEPMLLENAAPVPATALAAAPAQPLNIIPWQATEEEPAPVPVIAAAQSLNVVPWQAPEEEPGPLPTEGIIRAPMLLENEASAPAPAAPAAAPAAAPVPSLNIVPWQPTEGTIRAPMLLENEARAPAPAEEAIAAPMLLENEARARTSATSVEAAPRPRITLPPILQPATAPSPTPTINSNGNAGDILSTISGSTIENINYNTNTNLQEDLGIFIPKRTIVELIPGTNVYTDLTTYIRDNIDILATKYKIKSADAQTFRGLYDKLLGQCLRTASVQNKILDIASSYIARTKPIIKGFHDIFMKEGSCRVSNRFIMDFNIITLAELFRYFFELSGSIDATALFQPLMKALAERGDLYTTLGSTTIGYNPLADIIAKRKQTRVSGGRKLRFVNRSSRTGRSTRTRRRTQTPKRTRK